jgi:MFS family permease
MASLSPGGAVAPSRGAALPLLILALLIGVSWCVQGAFGAVQEAARAELGFSDWQLGMLQGLAVSVPIAVLAVPIGRAVDRSSRVWLLVMLGLLWSVGTLLTAFAQSFAMLFVARMLAGLGATCAISAAISLAADLCRPERRGRAMLVLTIGKWAGTAAAFALGGGFYGLFRHGGASWASAGLAPWRATHWVLGIASLLLLLPAFLLREPARQELGAGDHAPLRAVLRELWDRRAFLGPLFVGQIGVVMADVAAAIWIAPVLTRDYGLTPDRFGGWVGAILFGSGVLGSVLGGLFADLGQKGHRRGGILTSAVIASAFAVPAALFPVMPGIPGFAALFALLMLCGTICGLVTSAAIAVLVPNELRGLCLGAFIAIAGVVGFGVAPALVTAIAGAGLRLGAALALVGVTVGIVATVAFGIARRNAPSQAI